jgi:hypothetical protein
LALLLIGGIFGTSAFGVARGQVVFPELGADAWLSWLCWGELFEVPDFVPPANPTGLWLDLVFPVYPPEPPMAPAEFVFPPDCDEVSSPAWGRDDIGAVAFV